MLYQQKFIDLFTIEPTLYRLFRIFWCFNFKKMQCEGLSAMHYYICKDSIDIDLRMTLASQKPCVNQCIKLNILNNFWMVISLMIWAEGDGWQYREKRSLMCTENINSDILFCILSEVHDCKGKNLIPVVSVAVCSCVQLHGVKYAIQVIEGFQTPWW